MALFKIFKGLSNDLLSNKTNAVEGYVYYTTDESKFYIDIATDTTAVIGENRMPLNAYKADTLSQTLPISLGGTSATSALEALENLGGLSLLKNGHSLNNTDINNLDHGAYFSSNTTATLTISGSVPFASGFTLYLVKGYASLSKILFASLGKKALKFRYYSNSTWSNWETISMLSDIPTTLPASDVSDWAKAANKPSYSLSEITSASDVLAIEALTGTSGFLKKTAANKWELDTTTYVTSSGVTSITLKAGIGISLDTDNTAITTSGTRTVSLDDDYGDTKNPYSTKNRNLILASGTDTDGVSPSFRKLVAADLPDMYWANIKISSSSSTSKSPAVANLYIYNNEKQYARFYVSLAGTTTKNGRALLILGNNVASETDGNAHGRIKFYGYGTKNTNLQAQAINSDEKIVYLPDYNDNMYLIHAANNDAVGSNYLPIYADSYGRIKSINYTIQTSVPLNALFTDEKVKQTPVSNYNGNLLVLLSTTTTEETTGKVYKNINLLYNPSTNKLSTNNLDLSGTLNVTGQSYLNDNVIVDGLVTTNELIIQGQGSAQTPTVALHIATKGYVDNAISLGTAAQVGAILTIGSYTYNGSTAINIPIYDGTYS